MKSVARLVPNPFAKPAPLRRHGWAESSVGAIQPDRRFASQRKNGQYNDCMPRKMTATEAKARILALLDEVAAGDEVEITKHGRTVARLVPAVGPHALKGQLAGVAISAAEDEELFSTGAAWSLE